MDNDIFDYVFVDEPEEYAEDDTQDNEPALSLEDEAWQRGEAILNQYGTRWV